VMQESACYSFVNYHSMQKMLIYSFELQLTHHTSTQLLVRGISSITTVTLCCRQNKAHLSWVPLVSRLL
jgi:hypothetical protein